MAEESETGIGNECEDIYMEDVEYMSSNTGDDNMSDNEDILDGFAEMEEELEEEVDERVLNCDDVLQVNEAIAIENKNDILSLDLHSLDVDELSRCIFISLEVAYEFYEWYARFKGFGVRKIKILRNKKGEALQQTFVCHKEGFREDRGLTAENRKRNPKSETRCGCQAKFRVHVDIYSMLWYVTVFYDDHNHILVNDIHSTMIPGHRKMLGCDIMQMNMFRKAGIGASDIFNSFASQCGGYSKVGFKKKDMHNEIGKQRRLRGSDGASAVEYLRWLTLNDPVMFVRHTEDAEGRVEHIFWSDGMSQLDYQVFGDVVAFDATYGKNKYRCPVVIFSGVNNHNQTVVFATAIVANEMEETYVWLLEQFTEIMKGKSPNVVITDGDLAMRNAIKKVFPGAH